MASSQRNLDTKYTDDINPDYTLIKLKHKAVDEEPNGGKNMKKRNRKRSKKKNKKDQPFTTPADQLEDTNAIEDMGKVEHMKTFGDVENEHVFNQGDHQLSVCNIQPKCEADKDYNMTDRLLEDNHVPESKFDSATKDITKQKVSMDTVPVTSTDFADHPDNNNYLLLSQNSETVSEKQEIENNEPHILQLPTRALSSTNKGILLPEVQKKDISSESKIGLYKVQHKVGITIENRNNTFYHLKTVNGIASDGELDEETLPAENISAETTTKNMIDFNEKSQKQNVPVEKVSEGKTTQDNSLDNSQAVETGKNKRRKKHKTKKDLSSNFASEDTFLVNDRPWETIKDIDDDPENDDKVPSNDSEIVCEPLTMQDKESSLFMLQLKDNTCNETYELQKTKPNAKESVSLQSIKETKNTRERHTPSLEKSSNHNNTDICSNKHMEIQGVLNKSFSTDKMTPQNKFDSEQTIDTGKKKQGRCRIKPQSFPKPAIDSTFLVNGFSTITRETMKENSTLNLTIPSKLVDIATYSGDDDYKLPQTNDSDMAYEHPAMQIEDTSDRESNELVSSMEIGTEMESDDGFDEEKNYIRPRYLSNFRSTIRKTITNYEHSCREYSGISNCSTSRKFDTSVLQHGIYLTEEYITTSNLSDEFPDRYKLDLSVQEMENLCELNPNMYKKCTIKVESPHLAVCKPLDASDEVQEIAIHGRSKCGRAFTEDKVVVQVSNLKNLKDSIDVNPRKEKEKVYGEVVGTLERVRHKDVEHPVFVCVIDENEGHLMRPLCKTVPKIHVRNSKVKDKYPNTKQHKVELYRYDNDEGVLTFKQIRDIEPADRQKYIFLIAFIRWDIKSVYPLGAVIKVILSEEDISTGLEIIGLQHQVPSLYTKQTIGNVQEILEKMPNGEIPPSFIADRINLSQTLEVFTIDPSNSKDLDDALSIERLDDTFKVGVHIADVASVVKKDDPICKEARERGVSYYPGQGFQPFHMLPEPLSEDLCSLLPGKERLTFSIFFKFDQNGRLIERPEIQKTVVKSVKKLSYKEAWDIIVDQKIPTEKLQKDIKDLYRLALGLRKLRLKNASHALTVEIDNEEDSDNVLKTLEAHWLIEEFMVLTNKFVADYMRSKLPNSTLLRCQDRPSDDKIKVWTESHPFIADIIFHLQDKQISRERELKIEQAPNARYSNYIPLQKWVWAGIQDALNTENTTAARNLLCTDQIHPEQALTYEEWINIQESGEYCCSGSDQTGHHFSLNFTNYVHFTSPIRRYQDLVVQRQLHSILNEDEAPYSKEGIIEFCSHINTITMHAKSYHKQCEILHLAHRLKKNPTYYNAFVQEVTDSGITIYIPGLRKVQKPQRTIHFKLLDVCSRPLLEEDIDLLRPGELGKRQRVLVKWQKRLYHNSGYHQNTKGDNKECLRLDPHQRTTFMRYKDWVPILKTVLEHDDEKLQELYENICDDVNSGAFKDYVNSCRLGVTDVSSEVPKGLIIKHRCEFTLPLHINQVIGVQMSAEPKLGKLVPVPQICDISNNFKCCLSHVDDPLKTLAKYATLPTKPMYKTLQEYSTIWVPIIEMESATNAVKNEDSVTISNIPIEFRGRQGKISNTSSYFDKRDIEFDAMDIKFWKPKTSTNDVKEEEDKTLFVTMNSSDYVCIRCTVASSTKDTMSEHIAHPESKKIWTGHGSFTKVRKKNGQVDVIFKLHPKSPDPPVSSFKTTDPVSLEIIQKSKVDKRTETYVSLLEFSSPVAKAIALGKKMPELDQQHLEIAENTRRDVPSMLPSNKQQWIAIDKALNSSFSLIQGPPGTGKTFTGIKLIYIFNEFNKQLREKTKSDRKQIVFCGPSNKSVDLVALWMKRRLGEHAPRMVRMYGKSYENLDFPVPGRALTSRRTMRRSKVDEQLSEEKLVLHWLIREPDRKYAEELKKFDTKFKQNPEQVTLKDLKDYSKLLIDAKIAELKNHDVIFCTASVAANPSFLQAVHGRIHQCIIDESGMCTEPESMVPIIGTQAKQIVLIGDHKQLRPVVLCRDAVKLGLERSLFERYAIMDRYLTMLTKQYRMNPYICDFPSKTFYDGKLKTVLSKYWQVESPLKIWPHNFQKKGDPVYGHMPHIFCHIEGEEEILTVTTEEGNEQSRSNKKEVQQVKVFKHLLDVEKVNPDYINVISQYNAQCHAMKEAFLKEGLINIKINTVVASQGGEWDYVIFSTVRSLPVFLIENNPTEGWCKKNLGFITDHNQINVALTRARKGLIIIGNQNLLRCDEIWKQLMEDYRNRDCIKDASNFPPSRPIPTTRPERAPRFQRQ